MTRPGYQKLDDIWTRGCRGDNLKQEDQKRFAAMVRSRFHTFQLGMDHADQQSDEDGTLGLITGLASELFEWPGLRKVWLKMAVSQSPSGEKVNLFVEKLNLDTIH